MDMDKLMGFDVETQHAILKAETALQLKGIEYEVNDKGNFLLANGTIEIEPKSILCLLGIHTYVNGKCVDCGKKK